MPAVSRWIEGNVWVSSSKGTLRGGLIFMQVLQLSFSGSLSCTALSETSERQKEKSVMLENVVKVNATHVEGSDIKCASDMLIR